MKFSTIGAWLDTNISNAQNSHIGRKAWQAIEKVQERAMDTAGQVTDSFSISTSDMKENLSQQVSEIRKENKSLFATAMEIGRQGGLIGLMMKGQKESRETPVTPSTLPAMKEPEQHNGFFISGT